MNRFTRLLLLGVLAVAVVELIVFWPGKYQYSTLQNYWMKTTRSI
jgi:hypothetical protein